MQSIPVKVVSIAIIKNLRKSLCDRSKRENKKSLHAVSNLRRTIDGTQNFPPGRPHLRLRSSKVSITNCAIYGALTGRLLSSKLFLKIMILPNLGF